MCPHAGPAFFSITCIISYAVVSNPPLPSDKSWAGGYMWEERIVRYGCTSVLGSIPATVGPFTFHLIALKSLFPVCPRLCSTTSKISLACKTCQRPKLKQVTLDLFLLPEQLMQLSLSLPWQHKYWLLTLKPQPLDKCKRGLWWKYNWLLTCLIVEIGYYITPQGHCSYHKTSSNVALQVIFNSAVCTFLLGFTLKTVAYTLGRSLLTTSNIEY